MFLTKLQLEVILGFATQTSILSPLPPFAFSLSNQFVSQEACFLYNMSDISNALTRFRGNILTGGQQLKESCFTQILQLLLEAGFSHQK